MEIKELSVESSARINQLIEEQKYFKQLATDFTGIPPVNLEQTHKLSSQNLFRRALNLLSKLIK